MCKTALLLSCTFCTQERLVLLFGFFLSFSFGAIFSLQQFDKEYFLNKLETHNFPRTGSIVLSNPKTIIEDFLYGEDLFP